MAEGDACIRIQWPHNAAQRRRCVHPDTGNPAELSLEFVPHGHGWFGENILKGCIRSVHVS